MIDRVAAFLAGRTRRERWLLALLVLLVVPAAFAALVALPLLERRAEARSALDDARALREWYVARQVEIAALAPAGGASARVRAAPIGLGGIEESLIAAGLRGQVTVLANARGDGVTLALQEVWFEPLMDWLERILARGGYRLARLQVTRAEQAGHVDAQIGLAPIE